MQQNLFIKKSTGSNKGCPEQNLVTRKIPCVKNVSDQRLKNKERNDRRKNLKRARKAVETDMRSKIPNVTTGVPGHGSR